MDLEAQESTVDGQSDVDADCGDAAARGAVGGKRGAAAAAADDGGHARKAPRASSPARRRSSCTDEAPQPRHHPRSPYHHRAPDFAELRRLYPQLLGAHTTAPSARSHGRVYIDFRGDDSAQRALTRALLLHDFRLDWSLPEGHLCPTVSSRVNYLLWVSDLLGGDDGGRRVGVDVGTGAGCIYPLLGCRLFARTSFIALDADAAATAHAALNVRRNGLQNRIDVRPPSGFFDALLADGGEDAAPHIDFTVCNPPFFETVEQHGEHPRRARSGGAQQLSTRGGERAFIDALARQSAACALRSRVVWFTSLVGVKRHLRPLVAALRANYGAARVRHARLPSSRTARWVLAWSFFRSDEQFARGRGAASLSAPVGGGASAAVRVESVSSSRAMLRVAAATSERVIEALRGALGEEREAGKESAVSSSALGASDERLQAIVLLSAASVGDVDVVLKRRGECAGFEDHVRALAQRLTVCLTRPSPPADTPAGGTPK